MKNPLRIALLCWAFPLVSGLCIFGLWLFTAEPIWMLAGMGAMILGCLFFLVGLIALINEYTTRQKPSGFRPAASRKPILWTGVLLLSNFPIAFGLAAGALKWQSRYQITIHNKSKNPLKDIRVFGGGRDMQLGDLPPGNSIASTFWILNDGALVFEAKTPEKTIQVQADGYVTNGLGGKTKVTFLADESVEIENGEP